MDQNERRTFLLRALLAEYPGEQRVAIPADIPQQKRLLRALMNVRPPMPVSREVLSVQDDYLREAIADKGVTDYKTLQPMEDGIYLWQGDITTLKCDAIVNAANSGMTGCYCPNHGCIDNAIHTYAGMQLRLACAELMEEQGHEEAPGSARITPAFALPCRFVLHTVGPIVSGRLTEADEALLASCYRACLELAQRRGLNSVAFCCISTGEFHFPNERAAQIAVDTVRAFLSETRTPMEVIFDVFKDTDFIIYQRLLGADEAPRQGDLRR